MRSILWEAWCGRRDLNPHGRSLRILSPVCIPISPRPQSPHMYAWCGILQRAREQARTLDCVGNIVGISHACGRKPDFTISSKSRFFRLLSRKYRRKRDLKPSISDRTGSIPVVRSRLRSKQSLADWHGRLAMARFDSVAARQPYRERLSHSIFEQRRNKGCISTLSLVKTREIFENGSGDCGSDGFAPVRPG